MRSIAIIGKCSSTRMDAPLTDSNWEKWALAWDLLPVHDRFYEVHANWRNFLNNENDAGAHVRWLMCSKVPIYMRQAEEDIPMSRAYPFDDIAALVGCANNGEPFIESSIAFMMAHAILEAVNPPPGVEKVGRVGLWGIDMHVDSEYGYQKPNMLYLIGLARGLGVKVWTPPQCALFDPAHPLGYGLWESREQLAFDKARTGARLVAA